MKRKVWAGFEYGTTPEEAQARHDDMFHLKNTGVETWDKCPAIACKEARRNMGVHLRQCPCCGGTGRVVGEIQHGETNRG